MSRGVSTANRVTVLRRYLRWSRIVVKTLLFALLAIFIIRLPLQNFHILGHSMEPTFHDEEYIIVNKGAYLFQTPARGDVIVFHYPLDPQEDYIKRIIAIPGDIISVVNQAVIVNGVTLDEPYVSARNQGNPYPSFTKHIVGPDQYFVLGDNRASSSDSRQWGFVPRRDIVGKAIVIYWPTGADNLGPVPDENTVFAHVR